ncbi:hypothetical protein [Gloeobacter morelensis]|uniref:Uncharacterized protein n=1 Tax=Gloeobacter morelensis MG652769 TaxID=2781736 RepID=A0ABY3PGG2_9CYAN|nr:hypothetical protein [Gloeobacter morelensis]UFP92729.1 hypothetical protein ISF26_12880 [Gloeobacter morelensis MG652769]
MKDKFREFAALEKDVRVKATSTIWGCATGMLAICIPLVSIAGDGPALLLPLAVAVGAAVATAFVWKSQPIVGGAEISLPAVLRLRQLEERIANLETIALSGEEALKARYRQLEKAE